MSSLWPRIEPPAIGISFTMPVGSGARPDLVGSCLDAFASPTWNRPLRYLSLMAEPGRPYPRRRGVLPKGQRDAIARELLVHPDLCQVTLATATEDAYAMLAVGTRPHISYPYVSCMGIQWLGADLARQNGWVTAMLDFAARVEAVQGVIPVMNYAATLSEVSFSIIESWDGFRHPFPDEFLRMHDVESRLGTQYVRFPRWGTIYSREHVEQLGGVEHIREVVRPALIRDLGLKAVYFQLTESVATSMSDEALEKQRVFTELAEPLLPPPVPGKPRQPPNLTWLMAAARTLGQDPPVTRRKRRKRSAPAPAPAVAPATSTDEAPPADDGEPKPEPFF